MTWVITWVVDCGDGVYIEREQPSTALKPMPHFVTFESFTANPNLNKTEADGFMKIGDIKGAEFMGLDTGSANGRIDTIKIQSGGNSFDFNDRIYTEHTTEHLPEFSLTLRESAGAEVDFSSPTLADRIGNSLGTLANPNDFNINDELIENPGINNVIRDGIDINEMTGIGFDQNLYARDYWSAGAAMDQILQGATNGMVGMLHWTDFAEFGAAGNAVKAAGVVNETYECTSMGMTNAWNQKEQQIERQTGESVDLNGDGHSGDAPLGDGCDGNPSLWSKAWEAAKDWWNSDDDDDADADGCFDMPWLDEQYIMGTGAESYIQNFNDLSDQMQMPVFGYAQPDTSFHNMPVV